MEKPRLDIGHNINSSYVDAGTFEEDFTQTIGVDVDTPLVEMHKLSASPSANDKEQERQIAGAGEYIEFCEKSIGAVRCCLAT